MLEVIDDTLSVQKVHGGGQEIPVQRLGKPQILLFAGDIGNGDNLLERDDLNSSRKTDNVDVAGEHGDEEPRNHDKGPYCPCNKSLLLLLIFGQLGLVGLLGC